MASIADLNIQIGASIQGLKNGLKTAERSLNRFARKAESIGKDLTTRISLPLGLLGGAAVKAFGDFEKLSKGLEAITGDAKIAEAQFKRLQVIAQNPGIALEQAIKGSIALQSVGFSAANAEAALLQFSKAVTLSGGTADDLDGVVRQIVQINSKGKILAEDFNIIRERVPAIGIALQDAFGTQNIEAIRETGISTQEFTGRLIQAISQNEKFQAVQGGVSNAIDNFQQSLRASLATLGRSISESVNLTGILERLSGFINRVSENFANLNPQTQKFIVIAGAVAAAIGPVLVAIGSLVKILPLLSAGFSVLTGPVGITIAAIGALSIAFVKAYNNNERFRAAIQGLASVAKEVGFIIAESLTPFIQGLALLGTGNLQAAGEAFIRSIAKIGENSNVLNVGARLAQAYKEGVATELAKPDKEIEDAATTLIKPAQFDFSGVQTGSFGGGTASGGGGGQVAEPTAFGDFANSIGLVTSSVDGLKSNLLTLVEDAGSPLVNFLEEVDGKMQLVADTGFALGTNSLTTLKDQMALLQEELTFAVENFGLNSEAVLALQERIAALKEEMQGLQKEGLGGVIKAGGQAINVFGQVAASAIKSGESIGKAIKKAVLSAIAAFLAQALAAQVKEAFSNAPAPIAIGIAAAFTAITTAAFNAFIPKLATGGIVPPGFPNDTYPAFLSSGETVIPAAKPLPNGFGDGSRVEVYGILSGEDIYLSSSRAAETIDRVR